MAAAVAMAMAITTAIAFVVAAPLGGVLIAIGSRWQRGWWVTMHWQLIAFYTNWFAGYWFSANNKIFRTLTCRTRKFTHHFELNIEGWSLKKCWKLRNLLFSVVVMLGQYRNLWCKDLLFKYFIYFYFNSIIFLSTSLKLSFNNTSRCINTSH